jgi:hypothetical protein
MKDLDEQLPWFREKLNVWLLQDQQAIEYCLYMIKTAHLWDDLIDRDTDYSDEDINDMFTYLLVELPSNTFYQRNMSTLVPTIMNIILKWHTANVFEKEKKKGDLDKAYVLRAELYQLFVICATLLGGKKWGLKVSPEIWRCYVEELDVFKKEMNMNNIGESHA